MIPSYLTGSVLDDVKNQYTILLIGHYRSINNKTPLKGVLSIYGDSVLRLEIRQYAMLPTPGVTETCSKVITPGSDTNKIFPSLGNNLDGTIDGFSL